jgi:hypothetical protein
MQDEFDQEFKMYLYDRGINIDTALFELKFQPPQNFATYRQAELDNQRIATYGTISAQPYIAKRFALKRYLGLSEEEIAENERLWAEENGKGSAIPTDSSGELRSAGVSQAGISSDMGSLADENATPDEQVAAGMPPEVPSAGGAPAPVGSPPAA